MTKPSTEVVCRCNPDCLGACSREYSYLFQRLQQEIQSIRETCTGRAMDDNFRIALHGHLRGILNTAVQCSRLRNVNHWAPHVVFDRNYSAVTVGFTSTELTVQGRLEL